MKLGDICKPIEIEPKHSPSEEMIFMKSNDNVARCHEIKPFDVIEIFDREGAFEEAKKLQDKGHSCQIILHKNGNVFMELLPDEPEDTKMMPVYMNLYTNPQKFKEQMLKISDGENGIDGNHRDADGLMCDTLSSLGFSEGIEIFRSMEKWYE